MSEHFNQIGQALSVVTSADAAIRSRAEDYLVHAEKTVSGYYTMLQRIYLTPEYEQSVRLAAAIAFKNGIDKTWRRGNW